MWRELKTRELATTALMLVACAAPAVAQDDSMPQGKRPTVSRAAAPSSNATVNLINLLVKQGTLSEEQAAALIKQADDEAYVARQATRDAAAKADSAEKKATGAADAVSPPGTKRVTYVPEIVRKQLREEIRAEVMDRAHKEGWASPGALPEWISRIRWYGDVRVRYESDFFGKGNATESAVNYNAINTGSPYDTSASNRYLWPTYNTDQDRNGARLRARLGMEAELLDGFSAGIRISTGNSNAPISFNANLGQSGGNFSKYGIWLDRAYINYNAWDQVILQAGRFDNPFFVATDLMFHRDLGFDGFAAKVRYPVSTDVTPFAVAGAFPIFNTDLNAGSSFTLDNAINPVFGKAPSNDKWMFGGQIGVNARLDPDVALTFGVAYFDFTNVQGRLSSLCFVVTVQDTCSTDLTRPSFAQKGNTYVALRNIALTANNNFGANSLYQYFGLASQFRDLAVSARIDLGHFDPVHVILDAEYVRNLAWNGSDIAAQILNNPIPAGPTASCSTPPCPNIYAGGNQGWLARMSVGHREMKQLWDWSAFVGYKYLESDAVIDAFTDSDFGLGGTNLKGYFIGGNVALSSNVWLTARWMSANQVAGAPYAVDVVQFDLNARF